MAIVISGLVKEQKEHANTIKTLLGCKKSNSDKQRATPAASNQERSQLSPLRPNWLPRMSVQLTPIKMLESTSNTEGLPTSETGRELARLYKAAGGALTKEEYSKLIQYVKNTTKMRNKATKIVTLDDDDRTCQKLVTQIGAIRSAARKPEG